MPNLSLLKNDDFYYARKLPCATRCVFFIGAPRRHISGAQGHAKTYARLLKKRHYFYYVGTAIYHFPYHVFGHSASAINS